MSARTEAFGLAFWVLVSFAPAVSAQPPGDTPLLARLSQAEEQMREGKFEAALVEMDRALVEQPGASRFALARVQMQRGIALVLLDRPVQARTAFNLAICNDPTVDPRSSDPGPAILAVFEQARLDPCAVLPPSGPSHWPVVLMASGGVAILVGGVLGVLAMRADADADRAYQIDEADARGKARDLAFASDLSLGLGLVVGGTGLVGYLLRDESPAAIQVVSTGAGLGLGLKF